MGFWSDTFGGGNSFSESVANVTTPGDNYEYRGGTLYEGDSNVPYMGPNVKTNYGTLGQADSESTGSKNFYQNVTSSGDTRSSTAQSGPSNVPPAERGTRTTTMQRVVPGLALGAAGFGPLAMGAAMYRGLGSNQYGVPEFKSPNGKYATTQDEIARAVAKANATKMTTAGMGKGKSFFGGKRGPDGYTSDIRTAGEPHDRIRGAFFKKDDPSGRAYKINAFGNSYEVDTDGQNIGNSTLIREQAEAAGGEGGIPTVRPVATQATAPTSIMPAISTESEFAKQQMVSPPAEWLIANGYADTNPSYDALVKYNTDLRAGVLTMSEGGRLGQMQMRQIGPNAGSGISGQIRYGAEMGGLQQYGAYLDNRYGDPEFDQKRMQFLRDVNQQEQQTFGSGGGGSGPSSGLGGKGGAGIPNFDRRTQEPVMFNEPLNELTGNATKSIENGFGNNVEPPEQAPTNSLYKGLSPVFGGAMGGARAALGMAEGGDVQFALGGNEKDLINAAERAVRNGLQAQGMARGGDMDISNEDKIAIAQYVKQYGKPALMQLVDSVRTGEADETRRRFGRGENGEVRGNGDGSGTDDKITAQLKDGDATQDVLLADGEFVLRKDAYEALKGAGVNVDKVNDAGSNAAKELNKMMTA